MILECLEFSWLLPKMLDNALSGSGSREALYMFRLGNTGLCIIMTGSQRLTATGELGIKRIHDVERPAPLLQ